jgi:hypothetical protein
MVTSPTGLGETLSTNLRAVGTGGAVIAGYLVFLGHRRDYAGHAIAGYAGALGLLALLLLVWRRGAELGWAVPGVVLLSIALGVGTEATFFYGAVWDPVDFGNQSAGACLAGCVVAGRPAPGAGHGLLLGMIAFGFLVAGFFLALG